MSAHFKKNVVQMRNLVVQKTRQAKIHRVVVEARDQSGTNLLGARSARDNPVLTEPDPPAGNTSCDDETKHANSFLSDSKASLELHYCDVLMKMTDEEAKSIHCLQDSGAEISIIQKDLMKDITCDIN